MALRQKVERVHGACVEVVPRCCGVTLLFLLLGLLTRLLFGVKVANWVALPGFWGMCVILLVCGLASFAKAFLDGTGPGPLGRRAALVAVLMVLGTLCLFGGGSGLWVFLRLALYGRGQH